MQLLTKYYLREFRQLSVELEKKNKELRKNSLTGNLRASDLIEVVNIGQRIEQILFEVHNDLNDNTTDTEYQIDD